MNSLNLEKLKEHRGANVGPVLLEKARKRKAAYDAYHAIERPAREAYYTVSKPACALYNEIEQKAWAKLHQDLKEIECPQH